MRIPHPIPYQGSKRNLADQILRFFPSKVDRLIEPFAGSAAITIASAYYFKAEKFILNDINSPLIALWNTIVNNPKSIIKEYYDIWHGQLDNNEDYYYNIRNLFNKTKSPEYLLYLLARCVKAAVRYNIYGEFNQSHDKRRLGRNPELMREDIIGVSQLLKNKTSFYSADFSEILDLANSTDLVYLDPPYQGTGLNGGFNYAGNIEFEHFLLSLQELNARNVPFILSFDGRTGLKTYGPPLPENLQLLKLEINAGRSSQATLLNRKEITYEALYLSPALLERIDINKIIKNNVPQSELLHEKERI